MNVRLATLDFITGCLSVCKESDHNDALNSAIESGRLDWQTVIQFANIELVTPALWVALKERQLTESLPADVSDYLRELYRLNKIRNAHLKEQTIEATCQLNAIGIEPLLLKGAVGLFVETFDDPGSRMMTDIDILVPENAAQECWNSLCEIGYRPTTERVIQRSSIIPPPSDRWSASYRRHQHFHALYRPDEYGTVEVHRSATPWSEAGLLPTELLWRNTEHIQESGAKIAVPTPTFRTMHNLVHSAITDRAYLKGRIPLRPLHELAQMQIKYCNAIDWENIQKLFTDYRKSRGLRGTLYLSHRYFNTPPPKAIPHTIGSLVHYARTRLQVRWNWLEHTVEPVLDFWAAEVLGRLSHFTAENICARYQCENDFLSVSRGRIRLVIRRIRLMCTFLVRSTSRAILRVVDQ